LGWGKGSAMADTAPLANQEGLGWLDSDAQKSEVEDPKMSADDVADLLDLLADEFRGEQTLPDQIQGDDQVSTFLNTLDIPLQP